MKLYKGARVRLRSAKELSTAYGVFSSSKYIRTSPVITTSMREYLNADQIVEVLHDGDSFTIASDECGFEFPFVSVAEVYDD